MATSGPTRNLKREIHARLAAAYDITAASDDDLEIVELWQKLGVLVAMVLGWGDGFLLK